MGLEITVLSTTASKKEEALKNLGADHFVVSKNKEDMEVHPEPSPLCCCPIFLQHITCAQLLCASLSLDPEVWIPKNSIGDRQGRSSLLYPSE